MYNIFISIHYQLTLRLHILATVNNVAMNIEVHASVWINVFLFFWYLSWSGIAESYGSSSVSLLFQTVKSASSVIDQSLNPGSGRSLGEGNGYPLWYSCWRIPWTEEPFGIKSMGSQRVRHDWVTKTNTHTHTHTHTIVLLLIFWDIFILLSTYWKLISFHSHQQCTRIPFSPRTLQHSFFFLIIAILTGMSWYIIVVLISISLMIRNVKHLFTCLLAICISFMKNIYSNPVSIFKSGCLFLCCCCSWVQYIFWISASFGVYDMQIPSSIW